MVIHLDLPLRSFLIDVSRMRQGRISLVGSPIVCGAAETNFL